MIDLLGASAPMLRLRRLIERYAAAPSPVLIEGETGTGKERVARALHALSPRAAGPFIAVNCAALPDSLVEAELFGHERGAFTGAVRARRGKFALAHGGTLFLDEIGDLGPGAQAKILRVLEDGEVTPLGGERPTRVDVRVVSATHKDLAGEVEARRFRDDLYFRLAVGELHLPPLRERGDDVVLLAEAFLAEAAVRLHRPVLAFTGGALQRLRSASWPGNVRQLRNEVERAVLHADGPCVDLDELRVPTTFAARAAALGRAETDLLGQALTAARGNTSEAARQLGVTRTVLKRRLDPERVGEVRAAEAAHERTVIAAALARSGGVVSRAARALGVPRTTLIDRIRSQRLNQL